MHLTTILAASSYSFSKTSHYPLHLTAITQKVNLSIRCTEVHVKSSPSCCIKCKMENRDGRIVKTLLRLLFSVCSLYYPSKFFRDNYPLICIIQRDLISALKYRKIEVLVLLIFFPEKL